MGIEEIINKVTERAGVSLSDTFAKTKDREIVNVRQMICVIAYKYGHNMPKIARAFSSHGYKCIHTGISYAVKMGKVKYQTVPYFKSIVNGIYNED